MKRNRRKTRRQRPCQDDGPPACQGTPGNGSPTLPSPPPPAPARAFVWWSAGLILLIVAILYGRTIDFPFQFDDDSYLICNPLLRDVGTIAATWDIAPFLSRVRSLAMDQDVGVNMVMRPLGYLTFALNHQLDGFQPRWFRVLNIGIHALNSILAFVIIFRLMSSSGRADGLAAFSKKFIALATAALFAAHPMQTESTTYIVQRFTSMCTLFCLASLLLHMEAVKSRPGARARWLTAGSVTALVLGMHVKETAFVAPPLFVMIHVAIVGAPVWEAIRKAWPHFLCMAIIPVKVVLVGMAKAPGNPLLGEALNIVNSYTEPFTVQTYLASQAGVVLSYLRLLLVPIGLNVDPDIPRVESFLEWRFIGPVLIIVAILGGSWALFRRQKGDIRAAMVLAGLAWFFVTLLPSSSIVPLPDLMAEHRAYLGSLGALLAVVCTLDMLRTRLGPGQAALRPALAALAGVWVAALCWGTVARNEAWRTQVSLWKDSVARSPAKWRPWSNLGAAYGVSGEFEQAERCLRRALDINPRVGNSFVNLGTIFIHLRRFPEVLRLTEEGLRHQPQSADIRYNCAVALCGLQRNDEALTMLREIVRVVPGHGKAHALLGYVLAAHRRDARQALRHMKIAASLDVTDPQLQQWMTELETHLAAEAPLAAASD